MNPPPPSARSCLGVVLAAGEGVRMRSAIPKALHPVAGRPMIVHALAALREAGASAIAVVVGPGRDDVAAAARAFVPEAEVFVQSERRGTAHATLAARAALARGYDDALVVYADAPLMTAPSLKALRQALADRADLAALGVRDGEPDRLWADDRARRPPRRHPRGERRDHGRTRDSPLQRRADGDPRRARARPARRGRLRQRAEGILSHRPRRDRRQPRPQSRNSPRRRRGGDGRQRPPAARGGGSGDAGATAP